MLGSDTETVPSLRVEVLQLPLGRSGIRVSSKPRVMLDSQVVKNTEGGLVSLNVTEAVRSWQQQPDR